MINAALYLHSCNGALQDQTIVSGATLHQEDIWEDASQQ